MLTFQNVVLWLYKINWMGGSKKARKPFNLLDGCCSDSCNISVLEIMTSVALNMTISATQAFMTFKAIKSHYSLIRKKQSTEILDIFHMFG